MGLDMYLLAKYKNVTNTQTTGACGGLFPLTIKSHGKEEIGYWRKDYKLDNLIWERLSGSRSYKAYIKRYVNWFIKEYEDIRKNPTKHYDGRDVIGHLDKGFTLEMIGRSRAVTNAPNCEPILMNKADVMAIIDLAKGYLAEIGTPECIETVRQEMEDDGWDDYTEEDLQEEVSYQQERWQYTLDVFNKALDLIENQDAKIYYEIWY